MIKRLLILMLFISFTTSLVAGTALPFPDHEPKICFEGCHDTGGVSFNGGDEECSQKCHQFSGDISKLELKHNPKICKLCHNVKDTGSYHILHENIKGSCKTCHGDNGQSKPDKSMNECAGCHGGQIHAIHQDNISQICIKCHGTRPASNPASGFVSSNNSFTAGIYAKVVNYKQFTLFEVFKRILSSLSI